MSARRTTSLLALLAPLALASCPGSEPKRPNVLIFLVDTLRADRLESYGYGRATSPNVHRLSAGGVLFEHAYSQSPWTRTSVLSLFTGLHPASHGCQDREDVAAPELLLMAEAFSQAGYRTAGFSSNVSVSKQFQLDQGFDTFSYCDPAAWSPRAPARVHPGYTPIDGMLPGAESWLRSEAAEPFFLYFHCTDPHYPYAPPQRFARWGYEEASDRYDGAILFVDEYFQRLLNVLNEKDVLENTIVIFTADHGEEWGEHGGSGHGHTLYNELLHVPLIFSHPSFLPGRRAAPVRLVDVFPTLVELCGLDAHVASLQGRSLARMLHQGELRSPEETFNLAEVFYPSKMEGIAYQQDGWKLVWTEQDRTGKRDRYELFHTQADPFEQQDLAASEPSRLAQMVEEMHSRRAEFRQLSFESPEASLDEATMEALENLGYAE